MKYVHVVAFNLVAMTFQIGIIKLSYGEKKWIQSGCKWFSTSMLPPSDWLPPSFMDFSQCRNNKK